MAKLTPAEDVLKRARFWGLTIATAESCTGGMVAAALTDVPGSSDVFDRGFVTYSNAAKMQMLGVSAAVLEAQGAVSEAVVRAMADGARRVADVGLAVAISGIAGPGGSERKPEGRVCFAIAKAGMPTWAETVEYGAIGRDKVRRAATDHALQLLLHAME
jgi:nicotinamide-nucleotide amidase